MAEAPKMTRTSRHVTSERACDGTVYVPTGTFSDPTFLPRLTWSVQRTKVDYDPSELCAGIAAGSEVAFYCDTSVFDDRAPSDLWPAFFDGAGEAFITPRVEAELAPWLDRRPGHVVGAALADSSPRLRRATAAGWSEDERRAFAHYTNLLVAKTHDGMGRVGVRSRERTSRNG